MKRKLFAVVGLVALFMGNSTVSQEQVLEIEDQGIERTAAGQEVQGQVNQLHDKTRNLIDDYQAHLKLVQGLKMYNNMLARQLEAQDNEIDTLRNSISEVAIVERQILPMMSRMVDGLEQFIALDVPFLLSEREARVTNLRELLLRADVTVAEKARRVMEAYQIENDYGRTIEAYKGKLDLEGASFDADFLRVGRVALMYRVVGNEDVGFWDTESQSWQGLDGGPWRRHIQQGLKIARQEIAPELISVSINPEREVQR